MKMGIIGAGQIGSTLTRRLGGPSKGMPLSKEEEAKAMLERAVAAAKRDKAKALYMFNKARETLSIETSTCSASVTDLLKGPLTYDESGIANMTASNRGFLRSAN